MKPIADDLYRGPRPKSYITLRNLGFRRCISLQSGAEDFLTDSLLEHQKPEACGIELIRIRCSNFFPPTEEELTSLLYRFFDAYMGGVKTYMHCHSGVDRTGIGAVLFRVAFHGWTFDEAFDEWEREGRHWWFFWWRPICEYRIKKLLKKLGRQWAK